VSEHTVPGVLVQQFRLSPFLQIPLSQNILVYEQVLVHTWSSQQS
jgi:hypothetical protein